MSRINALKWTTEQRDAVAAAVVDGGMSVREVHRAALAGHIRFEDRSLEPFDMPVASIGTYASRLRKRRRERSSGELAELPPRDATERLRRRLVNLADRELAALENRKAGQVDPERLRQTARAVREISALPGPTDPAPPAPGQRVNGEQQGGQTRGGLAGPLLADHRATTGRGQPSTAQNAPTPPTTPEGDRAKHTTTENTSSAPPTNEQHNTTNDDGTPGSAVLALAARLSGDARGEI